MNEQRHEYLKVPEVAEVLGSLAAERTSWSAAGRSPSVRIGRSVRVSRKELDRWLEGQRQPNARWRYSKRSMIASWCRS